MQHVHLETDLSVARSQNIWLRRIVNDIFPHDPRDMEQFKWLATLGSRTATGHDTGTLFFKNAVCVLVAKPTNLGQKGDHEPQQVIHGDKGIWQPLVNNFALNEHMLICIHMRHL